MFQKWVRHTFAVIIRWAILLSLVQKRRPLCHSLITGTMTNRSSYTRLCCCCEVTSTGIASGEWNKARGNLLSLLHTWQKAPMNWFFRFKRINVWSIIFNYSISRIFHQLKFNSILFVQHRMLLCVWKSCHHISQRVRRTLNKAEHVAGSP